MKKSVKILNILFSAILVLVVGLFLSNSIGFTDFLGEVLCIGGTGITYAFALPIIGTDFDQDCNISGIKRAYVIDVDDIDTFAVPSAVPTNWLDKIFIQGSHTLVADKYWSKMYSTDDKGTLTFTIEGERDFEKFTIGGSLFYPNTDNNGMASAASLRARDVIILIEDNGSEERFIQIGTKKLPARLKPQGDWGTERNGEKGIIYEIEAVSCPGPGYIYQGVIPLSISEIVS